MTTLEPIADGLWTAAQQIRIPGGAILPLRMTVARLPSGTLWVHSPVALDEELATAVAGLGPVAHLVGPCLLHHLHLRAWQDRFPEARVHGAPGLSAKRPNLAFAAELGDAAPPAWGDTMDQLLVRGQPQLNEVVFLHRPSRTLIATDLLFNIGTPANGLTSLMLRLMGTRGRLACSGLWRMATKDRAAVRASLERLLSWDFDRLSVSHGDPVSTGAHAAVEQALWWGLGRRTG